jgi:hypothetical protein
MEHTNHNPPEDHRILSGFFLGFLLGILVGLFLGSKKGKQFLRILVDESSEKLSKLEGFLEKRTMQTEELEDEMPGTDYVKDLEESVSSGDELEISEPVQAVQKVAEEVREEKEVNKHSEAANGNGSHKKSSSHRRFFRGVKRN